MGCGSSNQADTTGPAPRARRVDVISAPQGGLQMVPAQQRDPQGRPIYHAEHDLTRQNLLRAFQYVAEYMRQHGASVTLVTVGGAVNTVLLRSRPTTHDVDFIGSHTQAENSQLLRDAATYAAAKSSIPLGGAWLNNSADLYISPALARQLVDAAIQQNAVVFQEQGLTILAAPWDYALCGKLDRLSKDRFRIREYDALDGAYYLRQYVVRDGRPISAAVLGERAQQYGKAASSEAMIAVNQEYTRMYGAAGIV